MIEELDEVAAPHWATARGFDLAAPHWDDLTPEIRTALNRMCRNLGLLRNPHPSNEGEKTEDQSRNALRYIALRKAFGKAPDELRNAAADKGMDWNATADFDACADAILRGSHTSGDDSHG